jgi:hypothetical protein
MLCNAVNPVLFTSFSITEKPKQGPTMNMLPSIESKPENLSGAPGSAELPTGVPSGMKITLGPNILPSGELAASSKGIPTSANTSGVLTDSPVIGQRIPITSPTEGYETVSHAFFRERYIKATTIQTTTPHIIVKFKGAPEGLTDQDFQNFADVPAAASIMIPTERRHRQQTISRETAAAIMTQTSTTQPTTQQTPTASAHPIHQNSNHPNNITSSTDRQRRKAITAAATITEPRMTTQRRKNKSVM